MLLLSFSIVPIVLVTMHPPESTEAGSEAEIEFSVDPADRNIFDPLLKFSHTNDPAASLLPVNNDIYRVDLGQRKIVFPTVRMEDAGHYRFSFNGDCYADFELKVTPYKSKPSIAFNVFIIVIAAVVIVAIVDVVVVAVLSINRFYLTGECGSGKCCHNHV